MNEIPINQIIQGDCLEFMKTLPDNCIDLVLTDPPYGIKISSNPVRQKHEKKEWDSFIPTQEYFDEICRISKEQIIWGGNYFGLPPSRGFIVWDKKQPESFSLAMCEMAWNSKDCNAKIFRQSVHKESANVHPTQKPVELMVWCLENYLLKKWDKDRRPIVFDGFAGSGTTGVACKKCGCDYILVEKEKDYCEIIEKRLAQETLF